MSDPASSPLTASEASSEVGVGELIHFNDDLDNQTSYAANYNLPNNCHSKEAKRVNRMLKNVDKDLARIKERETSRSISPERAQPSNRINDVNTVAVSLSTPSPTMPSNNTNHFFSSTLGQQKSGVKIVNGTNNENPWCSRSGLLCIGSIVLAVILICLIAYHFDHSKLFLNPPHHISSDGQIVEHITERTKNDLDHGVSSKQN